MRNLPWVDQSGIPSLFLENHARRPIHKLNISNSSHIIVVRLRGESMFCFGVGSDLPVSVKFGLAFAAPDD
jgi:hypothetical protein